VAGPEDDEAVGDTGDLVEDRLAFGAGEASDTAEHPAASTRVTSRPSDRARTGT
jgi:hypothetical protein